MKSLKQQFTLLFSLFLLVIGIAVNAQTTDQKITREVASKPFEVGTYMGENRTVNVMVMVRQVAGITLKIKSADDELLQELYVKKSPRAYHYKLNFDGTQSGQYKLEISDGQKIEVRRIDVVDVPAVKAQRYITFTTSPIL
ncbi:hypothetical protein [Spirosoma harenae]